MYFVELFYDLVKFEQFEGMDKNYKYWGMLPDGGVFYLIPKKSYDYLLFSIRDADSVSSDSEILFNFIVDFDVTFEGMKEPYYLDYSRFPLLFEIEVLIDTNYIASYKPFMRKLYVAIRGICEKTCEGKLVNDNVYCLCKIPACNREKKINFDAYTGKWANFFDFIWDIYSWMQICENLDICISQHFIYGNEDTLPTVENIMGNMFIIQGRVLKICHSKKLFEEYCKKE